MKKKKFSRSARQSRQNAEARKAKVRALALAQFKKSFRFKRLKEKAQRQLGLSRSDMDKVNKTMLAQLALQGNHNAMDQLMTCWESDSSGKTIYLMAYGDRSDDFFRSDISFQNLLNSPQVKFGNAPNAPHKGQC